MGGEPLHRLPVRGRERVHPAGTHVRLQRGALALNPKEGITMDVELLGDGGECRGASSRAFSAFACFADVVSPSCRATADSRSWVVADSLRERLRPCSSTSVASFQPARAGAR